MTVHDFNIGHLLPHVRTGFYRYAGSLTVPKCQESVIWTVLDKALTVDDSLVSTFVGAMPSEKSLVLAGRFSTRF